MRIAETDDDDDRDVPTGPPVAAAPSKAKPYDPADDPEWAVMSESERVEVLTYQNWAMNRIARKTGLSLDRIRRHQDAIDEAVFRQFSEAPDKVKARHTGMLNRIAEKVMDGVEAGAGPRNLRIAMQAFSDIRKIHGLDAPTETKSTTLSMQLRAAIDPGKQKAMVHDPRYLQHVLAIEQIERELAGEGDVPGTLRGDGEPGAVEVHPAPGPAQPPDAGHRDGGDRPSGDLHSSAPWEEPLPIDVVPGVVSGDVPRSEGDLG